MFSLTIVGALKATGIILTIALLIAPGAIAFLLTKRFGRMLLTSVLVAVSASFLGVYLSFFNRQRSGPTNVLVMTTVFIAAFLRSNLQQRKAGYVVEPSA